jgi:hypothetical protein
MVQHSTEWAQANRIVFALQQMRVRHRRTAATDTGGPVHAQWALCEALWAMCMCVCTYAWDPGKHTQTTMTTEQT